MRDLSGRELSGSDWRATTADDELRRRFADIGFDDSDWAAVSVPHHWRNEPELAERRENASHDGPLLYRHRFEQVRPADDERWWLHLDGIFYQGDIWLDGTYLGDTEGYFVPHSFEVTSHLTNQSEHLLAAEVTCAPQRNRVSKRNLTGVFQHWDCIDPDWNPGGIWRPVTLRRTGSTRIERLRLLCTEASEHQATLEFRAVFETTEAKTVTVRTVAAGFDHESQQQLAAGSNVVEWRVTIQNPPLWWPHALGEPHLIDVAVEVTDGSFASGGPSDRRALRTGLRQVRVDDWIFTINGERLHLKGANQGPARMAIAESTAAELREDLAIAKETGLDFIRMHAHIGHPETYKAADELGMLLWQDLPLQWGYARSVRKQAVVQAREAVYLLGHHPSIFHWCAHNEPLALDLEMGEIGGKPKKAASMKARYLAHQLLPTWNKTVLDFALRRGLSASDKSRPVTAHSGVLPGPLSLGTDSHLYFGWYHNTERDLPTTLALLPRLARFLSEFGAQAIPVTHDFIADTDQWPNVDWELLGARHGLQKTFFERYVPTAGHATFASWADATRTYQARLLRRHIEELRRIKYRPNGGFALFSWADARDYASVTWSVLGHDRIAKPSLEAVADACRPVIVVADRLPADLRTGSALELDVHVVNDLRLNLRDAKVTAHLTWPGGSQSWEWVGDAPTDSVIRVGAVTAVLDSTVAGEVCLDLVLDHPDAQATNRDTSWLSSVA
jgi:beta-mannosidase